MKQELTRAELEIMKILWQKQSAFVGDIVEQMPDPKPAYNTVSTIVRILERKGVVGHKAYGRSHSYYPLIGREEYTESYMQGVMNNFFDNSLTRMVSFFSEKEDLSIKQIDEIIALAKEAKERKQNA